MAAATAAEASMLLPPLMQAAPPAAPLGVLGPSPNSTSTCSIEKGQAGQVSDQAAGQKVHALHKR